MSTYVSMEGSVQYETIDGYEAIVKILSDGGWLNKMGYFVDEMDGMISTAGIPDIDKNELTIGIPPYLYRNLGRVNFFEYPAKGTIVVTCTDGCFEGSVNIDGVETNYDLEKWAKENLGEDGIPPGDFGGDSDDTDNLTEWQTMVESEFAMEFN